MSFIFASSKPLIYSVHVFLICKRIQVDLCQARIVLEEFQGSLLSCRAPVASAPICVAPRPPRPASWSPWTSHLKPIANIQEVLSSTWSRTRMAK